MMPLSLFQDLALQVLKRVRVGRTAQKEAEELFDALKLQSEAWDSETGRLVEVFEEVFSDLRAHNRAGLTPADEDAEDRAALLAARASEEEALPLNLVNRLFAGKHPVKVYRERRDLTQQALAQLSGLSKVYISQIETGKRGGSTKALTRIARVLNVSLDDLAPWDAEP